MKTDALPSPEAHALAHSEQLKALICSQIQRHGPMRFDEYWEQVLYQPGLGYYSAGAQKFGASGDFVTAPELGNVFARCLAVQSAEILDHLGGGDILELGAGSGVLCVELLLALEQCRQLPQRYRILERSADLRERQQVLVEQRCPHLGERIDWIDQAPGEAWQGMVLGNEVVDALAARRFRRETDAWQEFRVGLKETELVWQTSEADADDQSALEAIEDQLGQPLPAGYCTEMQLGLRAWLASISQSLERGLVLLADYGYPRFEYYHPQRSSGTLICHYRHHAHDDPFLWPGLQDISVNVEFTALAEAMDDTGLAVLGYTSQAEFLMASGLQEILGESIEWPDNERLALQQEVVKLSSPAVMGERFKVIAAGRGLEQLPLGFSVANHLRRL